MSYSAMLFDLDQTLIIKKPDTVELVRSRLSDHGVDAEPERIQRAFANSEIWIAQQVLKENETGERMDDDTFLHHIWAAYQAELDLPLEIKNVLLPIFRGECEQKYELMPGAKETLAALYAGGVTLGVVSNHRASIRMVLDEFGLTKYFTAIIISDEVKKRKPDPGIIHLALREMGAIGMNAQYTGDHPFDILCAHQAGIHAAWMPPNPYYTIPEFIGRPEFEIRSLDQLLRVRNDCSA